jgi:hypothetical protein
MFQLLIISPIKNPHKRLVIFLYLNPVNLITHRLSFFKYQTQNMVVYTSADPWSIDLLYCLTGSQQRKGKSYRSHAIYLQYISTRHVCIYILI